MTAASQMLEIPEVRARVSPVVLASERRIEVYRRPQNGAYLDRMMMEGASTVECGTVPGAYVGLRELFG